MRMYSVAALAIVLGIAAWAGVAFSDCGQSSPSGLVWLNPTASRSPAEHTYIGCTIAGRNTPTLTFSATDLAGGDGCDYAATLSNTGQNGLAITTVTTESTPRGDPTFASCFAFTLSSGPASGMLRGGSSFPYTFTLGIIAGASDACERTVGTVVVTFTGSTTCSGPSWSSPSPRLWLGPNADLAGENLAGLDLAGWDLAGDNLRGADLSCDNLVGANFANANLQGATLSYSDLSDAYLPCADLAGAQLVGTTLSGADFQQADLQGANLQGSIVTGFLGFPTDFNAANLEGVNLEGVTATGYVTATGATVGGALNLASCVATSGTSTYCDLL